MPHYIQHRPHLKNKDEKEALKYSQGSRQAWESSRDDGKYVWDEREIFPHLGDFIYLSFIVNNRRASLLVMSLQHWPGGSWEGRGVGG